MALREDQSGKEVALSLTHAVWGVGAWYASLIYTVGSGAVSLCVGLKRRSVV